MFSEAGAGGGRANRIVDPDLHYCGKLDPDPHSVKSWILIRIKVKIQEL
jgi:hypothetical protein